MKAENKNADFLTRFYRENIYKKFDVTKSGEVSFEGNVYDFLADYNAINKSDILNIHMYLMDKNQIK